MKKGEKHRYFLPGQAGLLESTPTFGKSGEFWKVPFTVSKTGYHCLLMTLFLREIT